MPNAVALLAQPFDLILAAVELRVARMVAVEAAGIDLDDRRAAAGAGGADATGKRAADRRIRVVLIDSGYRPMTGRARGACLSCANVER